MHYNMSKCYSQDVLLSPVKTCGTITEYIMPQKKITVMYNNIPGGMSFLFSVLVNWENPA